MHIHQSIASVEGRPSAVQHRKTRTDRRLRAIYGGADEVVEVMQNIPFWVRVAPRWSIAFGGAVKLTALSHFRW